MNLTRKKILLVRLLYEKRSSTSLIEQT